MGRALGGSGSSLEARGGLGEAHLQVGLSSAGSTAANCTAHRGGQRAGRQWRVRLSSTGGGEVAWLWRKGAPGRWGPIYRRGKVGSGGETREASLVINGGGMGAGRGVEKEKEGRAVRAR